MSFSKDVKKELCKLDAHKDCCLWSELYAMLLLAPLRAGEEQIFVTESKGVADRFAELTAGLTGCLPEIRIDLRRLKEDIPRYAVCLVDSRQRELLIDRFSLNLPGLSPYFLESDCCTGAFFKGAFLLCGSVTNPEKEYHLELTVPDEALGEALYLLARGRGIAFKTARRKSQTLLYLKESEQIEDFLTLIGAVRSSLKLMDIKVVKTVRNKVNRTTNCETANLNKTIGASHRQVQDIRYILEHKDITWLDEDLRELALLRAENEDLSLRELAGLLHPPISRSGVNHRLRRICEAADRLRGEEAPDEKKKEETL